MAQPRDPRRAMILARRHVAGASFLLGAVILILAVPRLVADVLMLPGDRVLDALQHRHDVTPAELRTLAASREAALPWTPSGHVRVDLATAELLLAANEVGGGPRYHDLIDRAQTELRGGLARAPADPYGWTRLAYAGLAANEPARKIIPDLAMAIETAPVEATLVFSRLQLSLLEWPYFSNEHPSLFEQQVRVAWDQSNERLVHLAIAIDRKEAVRNALNPGDRAEFDRQVADENQ